MKGVCSDFYKIVTNYDESMNILSDLGKYGDGKKKKIGCKFILVLFRWSPINNIKNNGNTFRYFLY